jgi:uncharacterized OB-fold protein
VSEPVLPAIDDGNAEFWAGTLEGELRLQRCDGCGHLRYPIASLCPTCTGTGAVWERVRGGGEIFSFVVFRHAYHPAWRDRVPYVVAIVQLDEGPRMISNVVGCEPGEVHVGLRVEVDFEPVAETVALPVFRPCRDGG